MLALILVGYSYTLRSAYGVSEGHSPRPTQRGGTSCGGGLWDFRHRTTFRSLFSPCPYRRGANVGGAHPANRIFPDTHGPSDIVGSRRIGSRVLESQSKSSQSQQLSYWPIQYSSWMIASYFDRWHPQDQRGKVQQEQEAEPGSTRGGCAIQVAPTIALNAPHGRAPGGACDGGGAHGGDDGVRNRCVPSKCCRIAYV